MQSILRTLRIGAAIWYRLPKTIYRMLWVRWDRLARNWPGHQQVAFFSGTRAERRRGQDYLQWLIAQVGVILQALLCGIHMQTSLTQTFHGIRTVPHRTVFQRTGRVSAETEGRDDVTVVHVPTKCVGFITGYKGASLRLIEKKSGA